MNTYSILQDFKLQILKFQKNAPWMDLLAISTHFELGFDNFMKKK